MLGLRRGEVLGLRGEDVDLNAGSLSVRQACVLEGGKVVVNAPKTTAGTRTVPLPSEVVDDLRAIRTRQARERLALARPWRDSDLVAVNAAGRGLRPEWYSDEFLRLSAAAKLPRIRLHDARHSAASLLLRSNGVPVNIAAAILGHDPVVYMGTYVHNYHDDLRAGVEALSAALHG